MKYIKYKVGFAKSMAICFLCLTFRLHAYAADTLKFGIDVLQDEHFERLENRKIGILTHAPATNSDNVPTCEVFLESEIKDNIICFFSPEHGLSATAKAGERIENERLDGIPVHSLYKNEGSKEDPKWAPTKEQLEKIDTLVVDLCDVGVRCYTYITCMRFAIEQCIRYGKRVVVLDRPNPLGRKLSGPFMDEELQGYVGGFRIPHLHGMTTGELAQFLVKHYRPHPWLKELTPEQLKNTTDEQPKVEIVEMKNYRPNALWSGQKFKKSYFWHPPSPNLPNFDSCLAYSCMIPMQIHGNFKTILASERVSENGEAQPFRLFCMYHKDDDVKPIVKYLNEKKLAGVAFKVAKNGEADGIVLNITDWEKFDPGACMLRMMQVDKKLDIDKKRRNKLSILSEEGFKMCTDRDKDLPFSKYANFDKKGEYWSVARSLIGEKSLVEALSDPKAISDEWIPKHLKEWKDRAQAFKEKRSDCLLYD